MRLPGGSKRILLFPLCRMYQQRVVTAIIIIVLILLIGFIIWGKLSR